MGYCCFPGRDPGVAFVSAPPLPPAPEASLEDIHQFYRSELIWISSSWNPHLLTLHLRLTVGLISRDEAQADRCLSAYLLLPGFLEAVRTTARLPGAKQLKIEAPIVYLRLFTSEEYTAHPEEIIITTIKQMLFKVRRSLSNRVVDGKLVGRSSAVDTVSLGENWGFKITRLKVQVKLYARHLSK